MWIKSKDDLRCYSLEELEEMCPKGIRLFVRLKKLKYGYRNPTGFRRWVKVAGSGGLCYTMRYGNVEIKKQTQIFVTVSYYFRMQV